jgi:hypothetical protein
MENNSLNDHQTIAAGIHLLTFGKWILPLGNFLLPLILWMINAKKSTFIDRHGRQALNFQISITLYTVLLAFVGGGIIIGSMISGGPMFWENINNSSFFFTENMGIFSTIMASGILCGTAILVLTAIDLVCTIKATTAALNGHEYQYPITIPFIPQTIEDTKLNDPEK